MKLGDILIYTGNKNDRHMKKNKKYVLIVIYEGNSGGEFFGVQLFGSDNEKDFFIRNKKNFITIKEYRKLKINKIEQCL